MTKLIRKIQQPSDYPSNQIHDAYSTSTTDTYSCNYINGIDENVGDLTQLNTTNKSNVVNAINEVNTNDIRRSTYTTSEQVIGKWIDGKPLYRKTITFTTTIKMNEITSIAHNITNAKNIFIDYGASFMEANIGTDNYLSYSLPVIGYDGNLTDKVYCYVNPVNINIYANGFWSEIWIKHITLKYTKTTD